MRKNKETIDIFKIYQESKLNPLKYEEKHLEKKVRYKTPTLTRNEKENFENKNHKKKGKYQETFRNKENLENIDLNDAKNMLKPKSSSPNELIKSNLTIQKVFEEIRTLSSFLDEIQKNNKKTNISNEELIGLIRNKLQNISSYETKIQNHSSLTGDENSLQKTILVSNKNEKNIEFVKTERAQVYIHNEIIPFDKSENKLQIITERKQQIDLLKNKILSRKENSKSPYSESFMN